MIVSQYPVNFSGIISDFGCGFHAYLLAREPREWEYLRCIIDGAHWQGHRKTKKG